MKNLQLCSLSCFILLLLNTLICFGQDSAGVFSYKTLLHKIEDEKLCLDEHVFWSDVYYKKALAENNLNQQFKALLNKYFLTDDEQEVNAITNEMLAISNRLGDKSLFAETYERKALKSYKLKNFNNALKNALLAEGYYKSLNNRYGLYSVKVTIGNIYFHTKQYSHAKKYYRECVTFFKTNNRDYNHFSGYISSLYSLSKTCLLLHEIDTVDVLTRESQYAVKHLNGKDRVMEQGYINYVKGANLFLQKKYKKSDFFLKKALPVIQDNGDINNEHVIYLFLGKNALAAKRKEKAFKYFSKIDSLFQKKAYLSYELREAYDYLINYYRETAQPYKQLAVTERLIKLNKLFEKEQQHLTQTLFYDNENKKLELSKRKLQYELAEKNRRFGIIVSAGGLLIIILGVFGFWQSKQQKKLRLRFEELRQRIENDESGIVPAILSADDGIPEIPKPIPKPLSAEEDNIAATEQRIIRALKDFEMQKGYLHALSLNHLAQNLNTNRNTLSRVINKYKQNNFNHYINSLRIEEMLKDLSNRPHLRKLSMNGLAEEYGFQNTKTFSSYFKQYTGLTPAYFIEQLEFDDANITVGPVVENL